MNGRIYEPSLGRMLSPDPVTQAPNNGQNYDRYTYAFNNPLKYTDPSGYYSDGGVVTGGGGTSGGLNGATGDRSVWTYARIQAAQGNTQLLEYLQGTFDEEQYYGDTNGDGCTGGLCPQPEAGDITGPEDFDLITKAETGYEECDENGIVCIEYGYDEELLHTGASRTNWQELSEDDWFDVVGFPPIKEVTKIITGRRIAIPDLGTLQQAIQIGVPEVESRVHRRYWQRRTVNGIETPSSRAQIGNLTPTDEARWERAPGVALARRRVTRFCVITGPSTQACSGGITF